MQCNALIGDILSAGKEFSEIDEVIFSENEDIMFGTDNKFEYTDSNDKEENIVNKCCE